MSPIKHQSNSFRHRKGVRYECEGDYPTKAEAVSAVVDCRAENRLAFHEKHDGGAYYRVFATSASKRSMPEILAAIRGAKP